jgi:hypothetical protein
MIANLLFAFPVSDITVARYLSARGVHYLGIDLDNLDQLSAERLIAQLREWTSGPLIAGVSRDYEKCEVFRSFHILDQVLFWDKESDSIISGFVLPDAGIRQIRIRKMNPELIGEDFLKPVTAELLIGDQRAGYLFHPGSESETGIFDYETMDDFLDRVS